MKELVIASANEKKKKELRRLLNLKGVKIFTLKDFKDPPKVREDKNTFVGNAIKKAVVVSRFAKRLTVADDSGLEVDILGGLPGVRSARFAGTGQDDAKNNQKLIMLLKDVPFKKRGAQFRCAIAVADSGRLLGTFEARCRGLIGFKRQGNTGFGYDPLFVIPKYNRTFAQLGPKIKDQMSHRAKAIRKSQRLIKKLL